jgi:hypothetical protein
MRLADAEPVNMPDFATPRRGVRHTIDTALQTLERLGVDFDRIVIRRAGAGWPTGTVVAQEPAAQSILTDQSRIVLSIAGTGSLESFPFPLREDSDQDLRADEFFALFDNPIGKLGHSVRRGGGFLELRPDEPATALRWIEGLFQISAQSWPKRRWYAVARLLPALHRVAGRADAVPLGLGLVFGLPVMHMKSVAGMVPTHEDRRTRLGMRNGRLGVDASVGAGVRALTGLVITIGPVTLDQYREHTTPSERAQRDALYRLLLPAHVQDAVVERWRVGTPADGSRLGDVWNPSALGVNSYLGQRPMRVAS